MRFARTLTVLGLALALVAGLLPSAWAQISTGGIYGKVTDQQSAVLPGATITLTGTNTGAKTTTSGPGGEFRFIGLDPATYTVSVAIPGFATTGELEDLVARLDDDGRTQVLLVARRARAPVNDDALCDAGRLVKLF